MGSGSGERRSFALERAVCSCTMLKIAWIPSQVDVAAQGEYCSMPCCQTGGWAEEERRVWFVPLHSHILPQQMCFLVSTAAFLYLELWDGLPPQNGAFSAVFPSLGFYQSVLLVCSCCPALVFLSVSFLESDCHSFPFLLHSPALFPFAVPVPGWFHVWFFF